MLGRSLVWRCCVTDLAVVSIKVRAKARADWVGRARNGWPVRRRGVRGAVREKVSAARFDVGHVLAMVCVVPPAACGVCGVASARTGLGGPHCGLVRGSGGMLRLIQAGSPAGHAVLSPCCAAASRLRQDGALAR